MLDLDKSIGSLDPGKQADFVMLSGDPFSIYTRVLETHIGGKKVFDLQNPTDRLFAEGRLWCRSQPRSLRLLFLSLISDCLFSCFKLSLPFALAALTSIAHGQIAVKADLLFPMTGDLKPIKNGVVLCGKNGKITAVGSASEIKIPKGYKTLAAKVVTPGMIDAHSTVGLSGILNSPKHDQEQLEKSSPIQPELRAVDAYNGRDPLVKWLRDLGVTTVHTGHAPGTLMSGQLMVVKTNVPSITSMKDTLVPTSAVASTLGAKALSKSTRHPVEGDRDVESRTDESPVSPD